MHRAHPHPWHKNSIFGAGPCVALNRDDRARYRYLLNAHFRAGRITRAWRDIGLALLKRLGRTGRCDPSYARLAADAGCKCARTAERALAALQGLGLVSWVRRLIRTSATGWRTEQTSNQYVLIPSLASLKAPVSCDRLKVRETKSIDKSMDCSSLPLSLVPDEQRERLSAARLRTQAARTERFNREWLTKRGYLKPT